MKGRLFSTGLLLLAALGFPLTASAQEKLTWKALEPKSPIFYQELTTETTQKLTAMQQETTQTQKQTFYFSYEPAKEADGDQWKVVQKIIGLKLKMEIGGNKIEYDSTTGDQQANNPMKEFFQALLKAEFVLKIDPKELTVKSVSGVDDFVKKLGAVSPSMEPVLKKILSEDAIKQMASQSLGILPKGGEIPKDKTWKSEGKLSLGPIGTYTSDLVFTFDDKDKKIDKITFVNKLNYKEPDEKELDKSPFPFKIKKATLDEKATKAGGEILFNRAKGRVESATATTDLKLELTVDIANMQTIVTVVQTQKTTSTTSDTDPIKKK